MKTWLAPLLFATNLLGQPPNLRLPDESAGIDGIARTLVSVFDQADIIALGAWIRRLARATLPNNKPVTGHDPAILII